MVEVVIDSIRVSLMSQQRIVILREVNAERYLPIWIGPYEAESITIALQEVEVSRPLTHDLLNKVFRSLDARVLRVEVTALKDEVYFGNIVAEVNDRNLDVDSRPSDALALAVRAHVPIMVSRQVMDVAGIVPEENLEEETGIVASRDYSPSEGEEEEIEERLSVFEDFLDQLDVGKEEDEDEE
jgi:bifunctional DNase/RNase